MKELSKSSVIHVRPVQDDNALGTNRPVIERMSETERLRMIQCTSCSKETQLIVFENQRQQCAPLQRLSKKRSLFTSQ